MINIALFGEMRVGKTFTANRFCSLDSTCVRISISQKLKEISKQLCPDIMNGDNTCEIRRVWQIVGNMGRMIDKDLWLKSVIKETNELNSSNIRAIIDDGRLPHEADFLRKHGFMIVRVVAPQGKFDQFGVSDNNMNDETENQIDSIHFDEVIYNKKAMDVVDDSIKSILKKSIDYAETIGVANSLSNR